MMGPGRRGPGFTLMEMLVVMAIVGILSSLLITGVRAARGRGKIAKTRTMIDGLSLSIKQYEIDHGDYPRGAGGTASAEALHKALTSAKWPGAYEFTNKEAQDTDGNGEREIVDAWGGPISYYHNRSYSGPPRATTFRLISKGPDGVQGTDDDVDNFE
jgi:general secretion pathway protein G